MPRYDRDEILARTDLVSLLDGVVGPPKGRGRSARWRCPDPNHEQTGKSPPVTVDAGKRLWHCHSCGAGGTAIDLLAASEQLPVGEAIDVLARRAGLAARDEVLRKPGPGAKGERRGHTVTVGPPPASGVVEAYVAACADALWRPEGRAVLAWLRERGYSDEVLRLNRVGADPGPRSLPRAAGLPARGVGAVFPVLDDKGAAVYCQVRYLHPTDDRKYGNPTEARFGRSPRLAVLQTPVEARLRPVFVCEGLPDALTAADAGFRAVAVLGAAYPDVGVAKAIIAVYPTEALVVAFDYDRQGRTGAEKLGTLLAEAGAGRRVRCVSIPSVPGQAGADLNDWARRAGARFAEELGAAAASAEPLGWRPVVSAAHILDAFIATQADTAGTVRIPTGIEALDELLARGGWRPGVALVGGLAGVGKSAFVLQAGIHAARLGHPVVYASVEQGPFELLGRLFCKELGRPISDYWNRDPGYLGAVQERAGRLPLAQLYLRADPVLVSDQEGTVGRVRRWATEVADETGRRPLVIVDYLQRMRPPDPERRLDDHRQISLAGLGLCQLARDLQTPVVAISSVNRQSYDKAPSLDAFKGSGDLEYDADACVLLRVSARSEDEAKAIVRSSAVVPVDLHVVKNRYGPNTETPIELDFDRPYGSFRGFRDLIGIAPATLSSRGCADERPPNPPHLWRLDF